MSRLLIRADAGPAIGAGHVMRCLALAEAWQRAQAGPVTLAAVDLPPALGQRLREAGVELASVPGPAGGAADLRATSELARSSADACVIDGYVFDRGFQHALRQLATTLVVDDGHRVDGFDCDLLLDQNLGASEAWYAPLAPDAERLLGTRYALLRHEFLDAAPPAARTGRRVLVTLGGSDPAGLSEATARALAEHAADEPPVDVTLVLGGSNPRADAVASALADLPVTIHRDARNMPELMAHADIAVAAAGSTCWELCHSGLPAVLVVVADNQRDIAANLDAAGAAISLGWHADLDAAALAAAARRLLAAPADRAAMAKTARALVDGQGADRVARRLLARAAPSSR